MAHQLYQKLLVVLVEANNIASIAAGRLWYINHIKRLKASKVSSQTSVPSVELILEWWKRVNHLGWMPHFHPVFFSSWSVVWRRLNVVRRLWISWVGESEMEELRQEFVEQRVLGGCMTDKRLTGNREVSLIKWIASMHVNGDDK